MTGQELFNNMVKEYKINTNESNRLKLKDLVNELISKNLDVKISGSDWFLLQSVMK